jgi:hypothetical protein
MAMRKKGFMYSIVVLIFMILLVLNVSLVNNRSYHKRTLAAEDRIRIVDNFIDDLYKDIQRGLYISSFRSILGIQQYIAINHEYINDTHDIFNEIMIYGTINGSYMSVMNNTEMDLWFQKIQSLASDVGVRVSFRPNDLDVYHVSPWVLSFDLNVSINVTDIKGTSGWNITRVISEELDITGFEDPMYTVESPIQNLIVANRDPDFTDGTDTSNLTDHITNGYYINHTAAPSYLMRLVGNFSNSTYGIESFVSRPQLEAFGPTLEKTVVDFIYFDNSSDPPYWKVNDTLETWFRLDNESGRHRIYEVQGLVY